MESESMFPQDIANDRRYCRFSALRFRSQEGCVGFGEPNMKLMTLPKHGSTPS